MSDLPTYPAEAAEREAAATSVQARDYSSWGRRVGAYLLDTLVLVVPLIVIVIIALAAGNPEDEDDNSWAAIGIAYLLTLLLPFVYYTAMHGRANGQTLGKKWLGIAVKEDSAGGSIGYGRAFGRYAIIFVLALFILPILLDYLWPLWDRKNQALHDKVVGSVVVRA
ncbi:MAG TPA: RDD family protein [Gaiellaceae bacterium]|nr:RDD family protein [Gaiellaceae bacterium]